MIVSGYISFVVELSYTFHAFEITTLMVIEYLKGLLRIVF